MKRIRKMKNHMRNLKNMRMRKSMKVITRNLNMITWKKIMVKIKSMR